MRESGIVYGRLSDLDIIDLCSGENPMISPFISKQQGEISFGLSSSGYDLRLSEEFMRQDPSVGISVIDPVGDGNKGWLKMYNKREIIIYPLECILASTVERLNMPHDVQAIILGKSTLARNNVLVNATPVESGFVGDITLEIHNCSPLYAVKLYVGQGIAQCLFDRIENPPARGYNHREVVGKYQNQRGATPSK